MSERWGAAPGHGPRYTIRYDEPLTSPACRGLGGAAVGYCETENEAEQVDSRCRAVLYRAVTVLVVDQIDNP